MATIKVCNRLVVEGGELKNASVWLPKRVTVIDSRPFAELHARDRTFAQLMGLSGEQAGMLEFLRDARNAAIDKLILDKLNEEEAFVKLEKLPARFKRLEVDPSELPQVVEVPLPSLTFEGTTVAAASMRMLVELMILRVVSIEISEPNMEYIRVAARMACSETESISPLKRPRKSVAERIDTGSKNIKANQTKRKGDFGVFVIRLYVMFYITFNRIMLMCICLITHTYQVDYRRFALFVWYEDNDGRLRRHNAKMKSRNSHDVAETVHGIKKWLRERNFKAVRGNAIGSHGDPGDSHSMTSDDEGSAAHDGEEDQSDQDEDDGDGAGDCDDSSGRGEGHHDGGDECGDDHHAVVGDSRRHAT